MGTPTGPAQAQGFVGSAVIVFEFLGFPLLVWAIRLFILARSGLVVDAKRAWRNEEAFNRIIGCLCEGYVRTNAEFCIQTAAPNFDAVLLLSGGGAVGKSVLEF